MLPPIHTYINELMVQHGFYNSPYDSNQFYKQEFGGKLHIYMTYMDWTNATNIENDISCVFRLEGNGQVLEIYPIIRGYHGLVAILENKNAI